MHGYGFQKQLWALSHQQVALQQELEVGPFGREKHKFQEWDVKRQVKLHFLNEWNSTSLICTILWMAQWHW